MNGIFGMAVIFHLAARDIGGERTRINRRAQCGIAMRHGAHMIFMRVRDEDGVKPVRAVLQPGDVRHDQVHTRRPVHIGKGNTQIDQNQPLLIRRTVPVNIGVHADLTCPAQGQVNQSFTAHFLSVFLVECMDHRQPMHCQIVFQLVK